MNIVDWSGGGWRSLVLSFPITMEDHCEDPHEARFRKFCTDYTKAVMEAGKPTRNEIEDVFVAAIADEKLEESIRSRLEGLRQFFKRKLQENLPLNWFCGEALANVEEAFGVVAECEAIGKELSSKVEVKVVGSKIHPMTDADQRELQEDVIAGLMRFFVSEHGPAILRVMRNSEALEKVVAEVLERDERTVKVQVQFSGFGGGMGGIIGMMIEKKEGTLT